MATTVTVRDSIAPIVVVAPDVEIRTDAGESFSTRVKLIPPTVFDLSGHPVELVSDAPSLFPLGTTIVQWTATDEAGNSSTATQNVKVVDRERPTILALPDLERRCDRGKRFATIKLKTPAATDNVPEGVRVSTTAGKRFYIGTTNVVWTAIDAAGNERRWTQKVTVRNRAASVDAGPDRVLWTNSEQGLATSLGEDSFSDFGDDGLRYQWSAPTASLFNKTSQTPRAFFPLGSHTVTLKVSDVGGGIATDSVKVTVKLKNSQPRLQGRDANKSFAYAIQHAVNAAANGDGGPAALSGLAYAQIAAGFGDAAGDFVRWEDGQSESDALLSYAELRATQQAYGAAAAEELLAAYGETGDESLPYAYGYAAYGTAYATADLSEQ